MAGGRLLGYDIVTPVPISILGIRQSFELQSMMYAYYPGEPDGVVGPLSRKAYSSLKAGWGFPEDELIDNAMLDRLRSEWAIRFKPAITKTPMLVTDFDHLGVSFVQFCLGKLYGFAIDGMVGPLCESAIYAWKRENNYTENLIMTEAYLDQLANEFTSNAAFQ